MIDKTDILQSQQEVKKHLQIQVDKPCSSAYFSGRVLPGIGERSIIFYALSAELRRIGVEEERALKIMEQYHQDLPNEITQGAGQDGMPYTVHEARSVVKSAYRSKAIKSYGCNSGLWDNACPGSDVCHFRRQLSTTKKQSRQAGMETFYSWLSVTDDRGKKILSDAEVRVYIALSMIEKDRGYNPGSLLYVTHEVIADHSGTARNKIGEVLERLFWNGLVKYKKGVAKERGTASEVQRIVPVPRPSEAQVKSFSVDNFGQNIG